MDKEVEDIMEEIMQSLGTVREAEREYRRLSPDERARLSYQSRAVIDSEPG